MTHISSLPTKVPSETLSTENPDLRRYVNVGDAEAFNKSEIEGLGQFAHILDPEGNAIELWEPAS